MIGERLISNQAAFFEGSLIALERNVKQMKAATDGMCEDTHWAGE